MILSTTKRLELLHVLKKHLSKNSGELQEITLQASFQNSWFIPEFIQEALQNICQQFLDKDHLIAFVEKHQLQQLNKHKNIGIVMAGNIPLVGFQDWLCCFLCAYTTTIKMSSKDTILFSHIRNFLIELEPQLEKEIVLTTTTMKHCDAYLTMGSNFASQYFEKYFKEIPAIIRKNKTSVAVLERTESEQELALLADDMLCYFGLGCRNVSKIFVPQKYDFTALFQALKKYAYFFEYKKYKNNYDYQLTVLLLNKIPFLTNDFLLFVEQTSLFSPLSCVYFEYYDDGQQVHQQLSHFSDIQCIVGKQYLTFGATQNPSLEDFPDNKSTIEFLKTL